jgi:hypothetical protein
MPHWRLSPDSSVFPRAGNSRESNKIDPIKSRYAHFWPPRFAYASLITLGSISTIISVCTGENMRAKIGVVIAGTLLAMFVMGQLESLKSGCGFGGSPVWAQESDDQAGDAASQDDAASQVDSAAQDDAASQDDDDSIDASGVSAGGIYSGNVMDDNMGPGTISAAISQTHSKLSGVWQDTFVPPAFLKGTVSSKGKVSMNMRFHIKGKCGYVFKGVFENGNEISGDYKLSGCKGMAPDQGTLDMTKQ